MYFLAICFALIFSFSAAQAQVTQFPTFHSEEYGLYSITDEQEVLVSIDNMGIFANDGEFYVFFDADNQYGYMASPMSGFDYATDGNVSVFPTNYPQVEITALERKDLNADGTDELCIWWSYMDGNSGIQSGFETTQSGLQVWDVATHTRILDIVYDNFYMYYVAPDDMPEEEHGKSYEGSTVESCTWTYAVNLDKSLLKITLEGTLPPASEACGVPQNISGEYTYTNGSFQRKK